MKKLLTVGFAFAIIMVLAACTGETAVAASTIAIDVNPSIELELDEDDVVINVIMNNEDAEIIIGDMDLVGVDYNVAINAILGSMVANGYINEFTNSVLISVSSNDETKEVELIEEVSEIVIDTLAGSSIEGSVITQTYDDDDAEELAEDLGISEAKAELILDIVEADPRLDVAELAELSIHDLNLLLESKEYELDDIEHTGTVSELGLITVEEAYHAALTELGIDEASVLELEVELEQEDGVMVYEVEIETETDEFEVLIDAKEGTVYVELEDDEDDDEDEMFPEDALTHMEVLNLIATELELDEDLMTEVEVEEEYENGIGFYEIEFDYANQEYELEVNALTGEVYSKSVEEDDDDHEDEMENEDEEDTEVEDEEDTDTTTEPETDPTVDLPVFTLDELATYTGANGSLAYIAVDGIIYDATNIFNNGQHQGIQIGGTDATNVFESSPHSVSLLESLEIVGTLE